MNVGHFPHKFRPRSSLVLYFVRQELFVLPGSVVPGPQGWLERASLRLARLLLRMRWERRDLVLRKERFLVPPWPK